MHNHTPCTQVQSLPSVLLANRNSLYCSLRIIILLPVHRYNIYRIILNIQLYKGKYFFHSLLSNLFCLYTFTVFANRYTHIVNTILYIMYIYMYITTLNTTYDQRVFREIQFVVFCVFLLTT